MNRETDLWVWRDEQDKNAFHFGCSGTSQGVYWWFSIHFDGISDCFGLDMVEWMESQDLTDPVKIPLVLEGAGRDE